MVYSYTQISQYLSCPRRYRYRYLDGWKEKDTRAAILFGRAFEQALSAYFRREDCAAVLFKEWAVHQNSALEYSNGLTWEEWLVDDQREASGRTDVLTYVSDVLSTPLKIAGQAEVNLVASTSGTDGDFVVKLIDVYPPEYPPQREMGGYQLPIAMDIFRGRYRESFEVPKPLKANAPLPYRFALPPANHVFLPGHRLMVQVQSSWFPLYDRNPQTFVPNIFFAAPQDYRAATIRVYRSGANASFLALPIVE